MRRRRDTEEPAGRDRWMVSYADFITVLFAFFIVLFASLTQDGRSIEKLSQSIHAGFVNLQPFPAGGDDPQSLHLTAGSNGAPGQLGLEDNLSAQAPRPDASAVDIEELRRELEIAIGGDLRDGEVTLQTTPEGFVISLKEAGFFQSGEANLRPGAGATIERIANVLAQHGFFLRIEGHSDDQPIHNGQFRSNWQLSTARAMTVLMLLVNESRLDPSKLSLAGYGPYRPVASNATPEGRRLNRRVDLVVIFRRATVPSTMTAPTAVVPLDQPHSRRQSPPPRSP
ncbi:MAG: OmpA family protein [Acidobacteriaceae bacterium]